MLVGGTHLHSAGAHMSHFLVTPDSSVTLEVTHLCETSPLTSLSLFG